MKPGKVFAGKGGVKPLRLETVEGLSEQFGGKPSEWRHRKGIGLLDCGGEECEAEIHWFQKPSAGKRLKPLTGRLLDLAGGRRKLRRPPILLTRARNRPAEGHSGAAAFGGPWGGAGPGGTGGTPPPGSSPW